MQRFREELHVLPFLKILIPFVAGIVIAQLDILSNKATLYFGLFSALILVGSYFTNRSVVIWLKALALFGLLFCAGLIRSNTSQTTRRSVPIAEKQACIIELNQGWRTGKNSARSIVTLIAINDSILRNPISIQLFVPLNSQLTQFEIGSRIAILTKISLIRNQGNPNEFDYAGYLARQGVYYSAYVDKQNFRNIAKSPSYSLVKSAAIVQSKFLNLYRAHLTEAQFGVASALTLGSRDALDPDVKQAFSASGAMHILAVSGLHVGVVYSFILLLFRWVNFTFVRRYIRPIVVIFILWGYAFITGLSPSVQRAALMLTIFVIGDSMAKGANFFNKLAFTALVLLFISPSNLFDVGFQLSFSAVMSIVYFQRFFVQWFSSKWLVLNYVSELFLISCIAQLGTLGFSLYYFHQFPNYFLITNLLAVPIAFVLVQLAVVFFILSCFSPWLAKMLLYVFGWLIDVLVYIVTFIESLPNSITKQIFFSPEELFFFYTALLLGGALLTYRTKKLRILFWGTLSCLFFAGSITKLITHNKADFVVFNVKRQSCWAYKNNREFILLSDSLIANNDVQYATLPYRLSNCIDDRFITNEINLGKYKYLDFFKIREKRILQLKNDNWKFMRSKVGIHVDWLILSDNVTVDFSKLIDVINFDLVIIDSSNTIKRGEAIEVACRALGISTHCVTKQGAFVYSF